MSKNVDLFLNSDSRESFSVESNNNDSDNRESENEEEKKYRISLENALKYNNYEHAFEKINSKISSFCLKIQELQEYVLRLGSKSDNSQKGEHMHEVISNAGDEMAEIFRLIEVIQNFEYKDRNQKIQNIKEANNLFDKCNKYKEKFDNLVNEIKQQNLNSIRQARHSIRFSNFSDLSGEIKLDNETPKKNINNHKNEINSEKKILIDIEMKKKQNEAINRATRKVERSLSRRPTYIKIDTNNENDVKSLEKFNLDYNANKTNSENNEFTNRGSNDSILRKKTSSIFRDMEKKVYIALEGQNQGFIKRYWLCILIVVILILIIVYYCFCNNNK